MIWFHLDLNITSLQGKGWQLSMRSFLLKFGLFDQVRLTKCQRVQRRLLRRELSPDRNQIKPKIKNTTQSNNTNSCLSLPAKLLKIVELLWFLTANWASRLWSSHFPVVSHPSWSLSDSWHEKKNIEPAERQTASAQNNKEHKLAAAESLELWETVVTPRQTAAGSHQVKPSQSRDEDESSHVTPTARSTSYTDLWSRPTLHFWIMRRGESRGSSEEEEFKTLQLLSWEWTKQVGTKQDKTSKRRRISTEAASEGTLARVGRSWLFWVFCNTSKPAKPRWDNDRRNEHPAAGDKLINTVDNKIQKNSTRESFPVRNLSWSE